MPRKLRAPGKGGARLHFDRTQVIHRQKDHVTVIPLDQVDHVEGGREAGPIGYPVAAAVALVLGVAAYWYGVLSTLVPPWIFPVLGLLIAGGLIGAYMMQAGAFVRIESGHGRIMMRLEKGDTDLAKAFVRHLLRTRTIFLEGVYEPEEAAAPAPVGWQTVDDDEADTPGAQADTSDAQPQESHEATPPDGEGTEGAPKEQLEGEEPPSPASDEES